MSIVYKNPADTYFRPVSCELQRECLTKQDSDECKPPYIGSIHWGRLSSAERKKMWADINKTPCTTSASPGFGLWVGLAAVILLASRYSK